ncbi:MAG: VIT1/CCC1 transporter family protein, partial [Ktedonobacteraceae bacterium]
MIDFRRDPSPTSTSERKREELEIKEKTQAEKHEVMDVLKTYGLTKEESTPIVEALSKRPKAWVDFMMRFELGLEEPDPKRALTSALTIAFSYIVGGLIPLSPYIFIPVARNALVISVIATLLALLIFGYIKGHFTGTNPLRSGLQTALIGG